MNNIIELVFITDCSKAMAGKEFETVGRINSIIDGWRNSGKTVYISTFVFNNTAVMLHDRLKIEKVRPLTISELKTGGSAALYDTVTAVVKHIWNIHHYIRREDVPEQTIFHIISSGRDTASTKYTRQTVQKLTDERKTKSRWQFVFENTATCIYENNTADSTISDSDFEILMKILGKKKYKW